MKHAVGSHGSPRTSHGASHGRTMLLAFGLPLLIIVLYALVAR